MSLEQMVALGFSLLTVGVIVFVTTRLRFFRAFVALRHQLVEEAARRGDSNAAARQAHELLVLERRLPKYGLAIAGVGLLIVGISFLLLFHGTRTI